VNFLTAPEWTSTNDSEEQMNFSCQSSGFAGILPFATHPPLSRFRVNGSHSAGWARSAIHTSTSVPATAQWLFKTSGRNTSCKGG